MIELAQLFCEITGVENAIEIIDYPTKYPKDDPTRRCPDISKLEQEFNFSPQIPINQGVRRFLDWAESIYQHQNLQ